ncbi:ATP synthase subunit I [Desulfovibrio mangrovi]|uniref:ATP synthase subunit I n=1 Tax=Desulfovibrio mangrovi TaxID=2976983 RepID=UPI00224617D3|nr:ATP synthase subunit I [Desulfovibrio mangrovi]UZP68806.1 ATP synthase subunit I [Desulfovibrio mangrovi]
MVETAAALGGHWSSAFLMGLVVGSALAVCHFGALWVSLRYVPRISRPRLWFWLCFLVRYFVTLGGMSSLIGSGPAIAAACIGFYGIRMVMLPRLCGINS